MPADIEINIPSPPPEVLQGLRQARGGRGRRCARPAPSHRRPGPFRSRAPDECAARLAEQP